MTSTEEKIEREVAKAVAEFERWKKKHPARDDATSYDKTKSEEWNQLNEIRIRLGRIDVSLSIRVDVMLEIIITLLAGLVGLVAVSVIHHW